MSTKFTEQLERWRSDAEKIKPDSLAAPTAGDLLQGHRGGSRTVERAGEGQAAARHMIRPAQLASQMYNQRLKEMAPPKPAP
jgi:hypothetical protein